MLWKDNLSVKFIWYEGQEVDRLWAGSPGKRVLSEAPGWLKG